MFLEVIFLFFSIYSIITMTSPEMYVKKKNTPLQIYAVPTTYTQPQESTFCPI